MNIVVASGKGGTGKTTFAVNLAHVLGASGKKVRLLDCDVEEPNDHLFVNPDFTREEPVNVLKPRWDARLCTGCGKCAEACSFNAIAVVRGKALIFNELCHCCGACAYVCPNQAITEGLSPIGTVQSADENTPFSFVHGLLNISESLAPAVVKKVKGHMLDDGVNIIDASPGTACPVVVATEDMDVAVLVTEPTPFGLNDLKLAVGLTLKLGVPTGILVNRSDGTDTLIADYAEKVGVPIIGRIPFRREYAESYSKGNLLAVDYPELQENLLGIFSRICELKGSEAPPVPAEDHFPVNEGKACSVPAGNATRHVEITIISGKGGTGKTTVVSSLAQLAEHKVLADNDVDAADLHLLLAPETIEGHDFMGGAKARIDAEKCIACGRCEDLCHYGAISMDGPVNKSGKTTCRVNELGCEGCGLCLIACPVDAVAQNAAPIGRSYVSETPYGLMAHAKLGIAEDNSGRLVSQVRQRAGELVAEYGQELILGDGPPGTGCPVIASVSGADMVLIVTEPTVSGVHDMKRVLELAAHFGIPARVIVNKADLNTEQADKIRMMADAAGSAVIGTIPFDRNVNDSLMAGKTVVDYDQGPAAEAIHRLWNSLQQEIKEIKG